MDLKYIIKILLVFILIFSIVIFIKLLGFNLNEQNSSKVLIGSAIFEGLEPKILSGKKAFCESNKGYEQETSCNKLTNYNCNLTSCCVWTSDNKCKAGTISGPTFNSDSKGKTLPLDYYYFQNKCYGTGCSKN